MKIYLATDHAGFELKGKIAKFLEENGYEVEDCGPFEYDKNDDYPDFISRAAEKVSRDPQSRGIVLGGSGQGEAIVANKYKNVRCALFYAPRVVPGATDVAGSKSEDPFEMLKLTREHNDSNMLSLGARFLTEKEVYKAIMLWIEAPFTNEERHARRIEKIKKIEHNL